RRRNAARKERDNAREDGRGSLAGQLLEDDRPRERLKMRPFGTDADTAWTDGCDYAREDRVDSFEVSDRGAVVGHRENLGDRSTACFDRIACFDWRGVVARYRTTF